MVLRYQHLAAMNLSTLSVAGLHRPARRTLHGLVQLRDDALVVELMAAAQRRRVAQTHAARRVHAGFGLKVAATGTRTAIAARFRIEVGIAQDAHAALHFRRAPSVFFLGRRHDRFAGESTTAAFERHLALQRVVLARILQYKLKQLMRDDLYNHGTPVVRAVQ